MNLNQYDILTHINLTICRFEFDDFRHSTYWIGRLIFGLKIKTFLLSIFKLYCELQVFSQWIFRCCQTFTIKIFVPSPSFFPSNCSITSFKATFLSKNFKSSAAFSKFSRAKLKFHSSSQFFFMILLIFVVSDLQFFSWR